MADPNTTSNPLSFAPSPSPTTFNGGAPFAYSDLYNLHKTVQANAPEQFGNMSLPDFSKFINDNTGSGIANAGLNDSFVKRFSVGLDNALKSSGVTDYTGSVGQDVGAAFGMPGVGRKVGEGVPRNLLNIAPMITAGVFSGGALPAVIAGSAATGALSGAQTYTDTGSAGAGLVSGAVNAAMPKVFEMGGQAALKAMGVAPLVDDLFDQVSGKVLASAGGRLAEGLPQRFAQFVGGNIGAQAAGEVAGQATSLLSGQGFFNPLTKEHLFETVAGNLPFAALGVPELMHDSPAVGVRRYMETSKAAEDAQIQAWISGQDMGDAGTKPNLTSLGVHPGVKSAEESAFYMNNPQTSDDVWKSIRQSSVGAEDLKNDLAMREQAGQVAQQAMAHKLQPGEAGFELGDGSEIPAKPTRPNFKLGEGTDPIYTGDVPKPTTEPTQLLLGLPKELWKNGGVPEATSGEGETTKQVTPLPTTPEEIAATVIKPESTIPELVKQKVIALEEGSTTDKPTLEDSKQTLHATVALRELLTNEFGMDLGGLNDHVLDSFFKAFQENNPNHPDPVAGAVEALRAITTRKASKQIVEKEVSDKSLTDVAQKGISLLNDDVANSRAKTDKSAKSDAQVLSEVVHSDKNAADQGDRIMNRVAARYARFRDKMAAQGRAYTEGELRAVLKKAANLAVLEGKRGKVTKKQVAKGLTQADASKEAERLNNLNTYQGVLHVVEKQNNGKTYAVVKSTRVEQGMVGNESGTVEVGGGGGEGTGFLGQGDQFAQLDDLHSQGASGKEGTQSKPLESTVKPTGDLNAGAITTKDFYDRLFRERMGFPKPIADAMTQVMLRTVSAFKLADRVRVTELINDRSSINELGNYIKSFNNPLWTGLVGIAPKMYGDGSPEHVLFMHQLVFAHELVHNSENFYELQKNTGATMLPTNLFAAMQRLEDISLSISADDRSKLLGEVKDLLSPGKMQEVPELNRLLDSSAQTPTEFRATMGALIAMSRVREGMPQSAAEVGGIKKGFMDMVTFAPKELMDYAKQFVKYVGDLGRSLYASIKGDQMGMGLLGMSDPYHKALADMGRDYVKQFQVLLRSTDEIDGAVANLNRFASLSPELYTQVLHQNLISPIKTSMFDYEGPTFARQAMKEVAGENGMDPDPVKIKPILRALGPFLQAAEQYPMLREIANLGCAGPHMAEQAISKLNAMLGTRTLADGTVTKDPKMTVFQRVGKSPMLREAFNNIVGLQQDAETMVNQQHPEVAKVLAKLASPQQRDDVWHMFEVKNQQNIMTTATRLKSLQEESGIRLGTVIQGAEPMRNVKTSEQVGKMLFESVLAGDQNGVSRALSQMSPDTANAVLPLAQSMAEGHQKLNDLFTKQPWWFTEKRMEKFAVRYVLADGSTGRAPARDMAAVENIINQQKAKGGRIIEVIKPNNDRPSYQPSEQYTSVLNDVQKKNLATAQAMFADKPEVLQRLTPLFNLDAEIKAELSSRDLAKAGTYRTKAAGREYLDYFDTSDRNNKATLLGGVKRLIRAKAELYSLDPDLVKNPDVQNYARTHIENIMAKDGEAGRLLAKLNFNYMLVGNLGTMLQEPMHQLMVVAPALTAEGGGMIASGRRLLQANGELLGYYTKGSTGNAEHDNVLQRFKAQGENPHGFLSDLDPDALQAINAGRVADGNSLLDAAQVLAKPVIHIADLARNGWTGIIEHNSNSALLAAYDMFKAKGLDHEAAYNEAIRFERYATFGGGKANRPVGAYSSRDPWTRSAVQTSLSLQSYVLNYMAMSSRLLRQGWDAQAISMANVSKGNARKAAVQMLATQFAVAGGMGMPFVGPAIGLLTNMFPQAQIEKHLRESIASLAGNDQELGSAFTHAAMKGLPSVFTPIDTSSRFGLGDIMGVSSDGGFNMEDLAGPTGNIISNLLHGVQDLNKGKYGAAVQSFVPNGLKRVVEAYRKDGEFRDEQGQLLYKATPVEKTMNVLGYTPTKLSDIRDQKRLMDLSDAAASTELNNFYLQKAQQVQAGDYNSVRNDLLVRQRNDPSFDARAGLAQIAHRVVGASLPQDPRDLGTARTGEERQQLLKTYAYLGAPSETQRLIAQSQVERNVGIPGAGIVSPSQMQRAHMADYLMSMYPSLTRDEANEYSSRKVYGASADRILQ